VLLVDRREHDQHPQIARALRKAGLSVDITTLEFGDVAFMGRGPAEQPVFVGIEIKRLTTSDATDSIRSGRLADHQLPGMVGPHGMYEWGFLVVEGQYRANRSGQLVVLSHTGWKPALGGLTVSSLEKSLLTYRFAYPTLMVWPTNREEDTVAFLGNLYRWFTDKPMDQHTSALASHEPAGLLPLSDFRATLQVRCPGMGRAMSRAAEQKFGGSLRKAALAPAHEWATVAAVDRNGKSKRLGLIKGTEIEGWWKG
jgi:ERCC4-type nuclease